MEKDKEDIQAKTATESGVAKASNDQLLAYCWMELEKYRFKTAELRSVTVQKPLEKGRHGAAKSSVDANEIAAKVDAVILAAAEGGDSLAQFIMGLIIATRGGVAQFSDESIRYLRMAAKQGNALAAFILSHAYLGYLCAKNDRRAAMRWMLKSAEHGFAPAQGAAGYAYESGHGVKKNLAAAKKWYALAAAQGYEAARDALKNLQGE